MCFRSKTRQVCQMHWVVTLLAILLILFPYAVAAAQPYKGRRVIDVLRDLEAAGTKIVFVAGVVTESMRVTEEPKTANPVRAFLVEILAPHDLTVTDGPAGTLLVVRQAPRSRGNDVDTRRVPPELGAVEGQVVDSSTKQPLALATVLIEGTPLTSATDHAGRFRLEKVPQGIHTIQILAAGYAPLVYREVRVSANRTTTLILELEPTQTLREDVVVTGTGVPTPPNVTTSSYGLSSEEIRRSAGSFGDISRFVQALPGLAAVGDVRNDLVARGGSPSENLMLVDGFETPTINHFPSLGTTGGVVSMLNNELISDATFLAGGFPAEYGNRLSSVLDIRLREGNRTETEFEVDASFAGASLVAEGPLGRRGSWIASARRSFLDLFAGAANLNESVPTMTSYTAKAVVDLDERNKLWFVGLGGIDRFAVAPDENDLDEPSVVALDDRGWRTVTGGAWQHIFGSRAFGVLAISDAASAYDFEVRDTLLDDGVVMRNNSVDGETTVKYDVTSSVKDRWTIRSGASWKRQRRHVEIVQPLGVETPFSVKPREQVPGVSLDLDPTAQIVSTHAQVSGLLVPRITLTTGARIDHFALLDKTTIGPRLGLEASVSPTVSLRFSTGRYYQQPEVPSVVAHPENADLSPITSDHVIGGARYQPRPGLMLSLEGYKKWYRRYPVSLEYPSLTLANQGVGFNIQNLLIPLVSVGRGQSYGVEAFAKRQFSRGLYGQVAYSWSRTEHAALDSVFRRGAFDTPHMLTIVGGYQLSDRWELSGRLSYATGRPYTPPLMPESFEQNRWIHDLSQFNAQRLPDFARIDLRAERKFKVRGTNLAVFADVQNLTNRRGVAGYSWNKKTRQPHADKYLGLLPTIGLNWEF